LALPCNLFVDSLAGYPKNRSLPSFSPSFGLRSQPSFRTFQAKASGDLFIEDFQLNVIFRTPLFPTNDSFHSQTRFSALCKTLFQGRPHLLFGVGRLDFNPENLPVGSAGSLFGLRGLFLTTLKKWRKL